PKLVDEAVALAARLIDDHPLLVTAIGVRRGSPGRAAVQRREDLGREVAVETVVEELAGGVHAQHRVAPEDAWLDLPRHPGGATVGRVAEARIAEVGCDRVELPPADHHAIVIRGVDRNGGLVRGVPEVFAPARFTFTWMCVNRPKVIADAMLAPVGARAGIPGGSSSPTRPPAR